MALSSCFLSSQAYFSFRFDPSRFSSHTAYNNQRCVLAFKRANNELLGQKGVTKEVYPCHSWSFLEGTRSIRGPNLGTTTLRRKSSAVYASWLPNSQIASSAFTLGTAAVLPFYTFMVVAPQAEFTKKLVKNSIPYILLGVLYSYILYLSWTPDTIRMMFASKYWLPELTGIAKMFSSEMTLASAWIHLLAVDLFAARQVYLDGLQDNVETRHSVSLCLLFCPIGIVSHFITKAITKMNKKSERRTN